MEDCCNTQATEQAPQPARKLPLFKKPLHEHITVEVIDQPGPGGANHVYAIRMDHGPDCQFPMIFPISFQKGAVNEAGLNGISDECLLAIVKDRLQGFQRGEFSCRENAIALTKLEECMMWLEVGHKNRIARIEGGAKK